MDSVALSQFDIDFIIPNSFLCGWASPLDLYCEKQTSFVHK